MHWPHPRRFMLLPVGGEGLEPTPPNPQNTIFSPSGGAESGALGAQLGALPPELMAVVEAWPSLPEGVKASILAAVRKIQSH